MNGHWYCTDCEERIEKADIDDHEADGHHVKGHFRPERLLPGDPDAITSGVDTKNTGGDS